MAYMYLDILDTLGNADIDSYAFLFSGVPFIYYPINLNYGNPETENVLL